MQILRTNLYRYFEYNFFFCYMNCFPIPLSLRGHFSTTFELTYNVRVSFQTGLSDALIVLVFFLTVSESGISFSFTYGSDSPLGSIGIKFLPSLTKIKVKQYVANQTKYCLWCNFGNSLGTGFNTQSFFSYFCHYQWENKNNSLCPVCIFKVYLLPRIEKKICRK